MPSTRVKNPREASGSRTRSIVCWKKKPRVSGGGGETPYGSKQQWWRTSVALCRPVVGCGGGGGIHDMLQTACCLLSVNRFETSTHRQGVQVCSAHRLGSVCEGTKEPQDRSHS